VREVVLDASVVLKWFRATGEHSVGAARAVRTEFEAGRTLAFAPPLLFLEILNIAGRRWRLPAPQLDHLASTLPNLGFQLVEPDLLTIASWVGHGLTGYDAAYLAVAEQTGAQLITDDRQILGVAPSLSSPLADHA
jgi:predicted nucleic acid-binding protein